MNCTETVAIRLGFFLEGDINAGQEERMAHRNQIRGFLGPHHAGNLSDSQDIALLNSVTDVIKHRDSPRITLLAESQNNELWFKRMQAIKNYFERMEVPDLRISFELETPRQYEGGSDNGKVEIRF